MPFLTAFAAASWLSNHVFLTLKPSLTITQTCIRRLGHDSLLGDELEGFLVERSHVLTWQSDIGNPP